MPTYLYRCPSGHVTELVQSIHEDLPPTLPCSRRVTNREFVAYDGHPRELALATFPGDSYVLVDDPDPTAADRAMQCAHEAVRVFHAPAAIHFKGPGFYSTDVKGSQERRRRPNAGDDLFRPHDAAAAAIARSL